MCKGHRGGKKQHTAHGSPLLVHVHVHLDESENEIAQPGFHTYLQMRRYCSMLGSRCTTAGDERRLSAKKLMSTHCSRLH